MVKVSVIVPVYNVAKWIERCARSLFEQTLEDMEFIFVDDASPDESISILKRVMLDYPGRACQVNIVTHEANLGSSYARNTGMTIAKGEYIAYCDSDDWVSNDMYASLYEEARRNDSDVCYCDFYEVTVKGCIQTKAVDLETDKVLFLRNYMCGGLTVVWNLLVKRKLCEEHGLRFSESFMYCEDFGWTVRVFYFARKISKVSYPYYFYNLMNTSSLLHTSNPKIMRDELCCYKSTIDFFKKQAVLDLYHKEICWRILKATQDLVLSPSTYKDFLGIYPPSHQYICSCPDSFCNKKIKIMMWLLVHKAGFIVTFINRVRALFR